MSPYQELQSRQENFFPFVGMFGSVLIGGIAVASGDSLEDRVGGFLVAAIVFGANLWYAKRRLVVEVDGDFLRIRSSFDTTSIRLAEVSSVEIRSLEGAGRTLASYAPALRPVRLLGWEGNGVVRIHRDARIVDVRSRDPEALAAAIRERLGAEGPASSRPDVERPFCPS